MTPAGLHQALERYSTTVTELEKAEPSPSVEQILAVLKARDSIHAALTDRSQDDIKGLIHVVELDSRLKRQSGRIAKTIQLANWRASFQPPVQAWWWFVELPPSQWDRYDWLWSSLTILCLTVSLGLIADISSRFLSGGPDTWAAFAVVGQSVLALLAAGGALTLAGQEALKRILASLKVPAYFWHEAKFALGVLLLAGLLILRFSLPGIAISYNNHGLQNYNAGLLTSAQFDYQRDV